ncbi:hypothetical protein MAR_001804, partial [Mya arenaria]
MQQWLRRNAENGNAYIEGASTLNQRIECWWGYLRRQHVQYWMNKLRQLQEDGEFSGSAVDKSLVQFCFMAILQFVCFRASYHWRLLCGTTIQYGAVETPTFHEDNQMECLTSPNCGIQETTGLSHPGRKLMLVVVKSSSGPQCAATQLSTTCVHTLWQQTTVSTQTLLTRQ